MPEPGFSSALQTQLSSSAALSPIHPGPFVSSRSARAYAAWWLYHSTLVGPASPCTQSDTQHGAGTDVLWRAGALLVPLVRCFFSYWVPARVWAAGIVMMWRQQQGSGHPPSSPRPCITPKGTPKGFSYGCDKVGIERLCGRGSGTPLAEIFFFFCSRLLTIPGPFSIADSPGPLINGGPGLLRGLRSFC